MALEKNPVHYNASKQIEVRYHLVRYYVTKGKLGLEKVSTADNVVDEMPNSLSANRF